MRIKELSLEEKQHERDKSRIISNIYSTLKEDDQIKTKEDLVNFFEKNYKEYIRDFGKTEPTLYEKTFNYETTYHYRGFDIDIFNDDCGQQNYFFFNGRVIGCGAYNSFWEECVEYEIDEFLDNIFDFYIIDKKYAGARLIYLDHEHKKIGLKYRVEILKEFTAKESNIDTIKQKSKEILEYLFNSLEFQKHEEERTRRGDLFISELMEKEIKVN